MFKANSRRLYGLTILAMLFVSVFVPAFIIQPVIGQGDWWNTNWLYRKVISIDYTKVDADLTNFSVLIDITDADLMSKAQSDGDDIVFTDSSENKLDHETEFYDGITGHLIAWVRVPSLSSTTDTVLYMYYGNLFASNQENSEAVWDSHYMIVQHLEETSGTQYDSTSNNNDGTPHGGMNKSAVGQIDGADEFDGSDDYIDTGMADDGLSSSFTVSLWFKTTALSNDMWEHMISSYDSTGFMIAHNNVENRPWFYMGGDNVLFSSGIYDDSWHYLVGTFDGSTIKSYTDGSFNQSTATSFSNGPTTIKIGCVGAPKYYFNGTIDEVRISKVVRSDGWISTSYNNQHDPSSFYTVGSEEMPEAPVVSDPSPSDGAISVSVLLSELRFNLTDYQGDLMNYTVTTSPDIGFGSGVNVGDGRYTVSVSGLGYGATYTWYVNVTDGTLWTNKTFTFTTETEEPQITNENPTDGATGVSLNPTLQAYIFDAQGDSVDWLIRTNASGAWTTLASGNLPSGSGIVSASTTNMDSYNTTYYWRVCATDPAGSGQWTNETYSFTTKETWQITHKWTVAMPNTVRRGACVADINGDGVKEVVQGYSGGVRALFGTNGSTIWTYTDSLILSECQTEIGDLDNDGIPEILVGLLEGIVALHGNGSLYWRRTDLGGDCHGYMPLIFDLDGDGYPTVFVATKTGSGSFKGQRVWAISYDGQILYYSDPIQKPCWGGISLMDYDNDGHFEIYITDMSTVKSYWAENLTLRWAKSVGGVNAHAPQLVDVTGDGIRDIVVYPGQCNMPETYVAVLSAADGHVIGTSSENVSVCLTPAIYDIDGDGNPEVIGSGAAGDGSNRLTVYDLVTWSMDADIPLTSGARDQPRVADVTGDGKMEILVPDGGLRIFNSTYDEIAHITCGTIYPTVQDLDGDGLNEILVSSGSSVYVYDTDAPSPPGGVRSGIKFYSEYRLGAAEYVPPPGTRAPKLEMDPTSVTCRKQCEHFTVEINVSHAVNVEDFAFEIWYNTTLLDYAGLTWGSFLDGAKHIDLIDEGAGVIEGHIDPGTPVSGSGWLLNITFHANKTLIWKDCPGWVNKLEGQIWFHWAELSRSVGPDLWYEEWTGGRREIEVNKVDYTYLPIQGDVDSDGDVDIFDLRTAAALYNVKNGDPLWPTASTYDLNCDGIIDIFDLVIIAVKFGTTYP